MAFKMMWKLVAHYRRENERLADSNCDLMRQLEDAQARSKALQRELDDLSRSNGRHDEAVIRLKRDRSALAEELESKKVEAARYKSLYQLATAGDGQAEDVPKLKEELSELRCRRAAKLKDVGVESLARQVSGAALSGKGRTIVTLVDSAGSTVLELSGNVFGPEGGTRSAACSFSGAKGGLLRMEPADQTLFEGGRIQKGSQEALKAYLAEHADTVVFDADYWPELSKNATGEQRPKRFANPQVIVA